MQNAKRKVQGVGTALRLQQNQYGWNVGAGLRACPRTIWHLRTSTETRPYKPKSIGHPERSEGSRC